MQILLVYRRFVNGRIESATNVDSRALPSANGMDVSAHFVSRTLRALGHEPRIVPAIYVKPFLKGQKNDYNDAEAIAEAATAEPAVRPGEEPGSTGPAGLPPGAVEGSLVVLAVAALGDILRDDLVDRRDRNTGTAGDLLRAGRAGAAFVGEAVDDAAHPAGAREQRQPRPQAIVPRLPYFAVAGRLG